jgi:hypothetical protein
MLRSLLRFSVRDVIWLTLVVALVVGWLINHRAQVLRLVDANAKLTEYQADARAARENALASQKMALRLQEAMKQKTADGD